MSAFGFIRRHGLWGLCTAAIAINVVLLGTVVALAWYFLWPVVSDAAAWIVGDGQSSMAIIDGLRRVAAGVFWFLAAALLLGAGSVAVLLLGQAVASPFLDLLSERVESIVLGRAAEQFSVRRAVVGVAVAFSDLLWGLVFFLVAQVAFFLLGLIPVIGTAPASVLSFSFSALLLTQEFAGLPMARQLVSYRGRWRMVWRYKWLSLGFGSSTMVMLVVPGINLVLLPVAAVGGTLLYCDLAMAGGLREVESR